MLIIDAHLDLAWNAVSYDRDQLQPIESLRKAEAHMTGKSRGGCTVSLPELRRGEVGICLATILARSYPPQSVLLDKVGAIGNRTRGKITLRENLDFANQTIACAAAQAQLAYYQLLEQQGHLRFVRDRATLDELWSQWTNGGTDAPLGIILSMEGADPIIEPDQAQWWWQQGLRTACLAHYGPSAYAMGTGGDGPLTDRGRQLLKEFDRLGIILDLVHTADSALAEALDRYEGSVFVSHGNCRALVQHDRQMTDDQIRLICERGGVIGIVLDCWMLKANYRSSDRDQVSLETLADHIDHICQLTGNRNHVGIGSDLDGGFGIEQVPHDMNTIADLQNIEPILTERGYSESDVAAIFHGNWLRFFREAM